MQNGGNASTIFAADGSGLHDEPAICQVYGIALHTHVDEASKRKRDAVGFANAARIVACVNACEGMENPADEIGAMKAAEAQAEQDERDMEAMRQQRDELAAALRHIDSMLHRDHPNHPWIAGADAPEAIRVIRAALAKVTP